MTDKFGTTHSAFILKSVAEPMRATAAPKFPFGLCDTAFLIALSLVAMLHPLAWAAHPPDVDPINFVAALSVYDVSIDAPHPPGYPLYVMLARASSTVVSAGHAYQLVNLVMFLVAGCAIYAIGRRLAHPSSGLVAAGLWLSHPLAWAATVVQESYVADACFASLLVVAWLYRLTPILATFLLYVLFCLIRPVTGAMLFPLVATLAYVLSGRIGEVAKTLAVAGAGLALSYAVTVWMAGGLDVYAAASSRVMGAAVRASSAFAGAPLLAHITMVTKLAAWNAGLVAPLIVALLATRSWPTRTHLWLVSAWLVGPLAFYLAIYYLKPTYLLIILPAYLLAFAVWNRSRWLPVALITAQTVFFWFGSHSLPTPMYRLTERYVATKDAEWEKLLESLPSQGDVNDVILWDKAPLPIQASRLLRWKGRVAISTAAGLSYLEPLRMHWLAGPPPAVGKTYSVQEDGRILATQ